MVYGMKNLPITFGRVLKIPRPKRVATEKVLSNPEEILKFVVDSYKSLIDGCLLRARPQLTWSRRSLDQVDLRLALFPQASPPNVHRGINRG